MIFSLTTEDILWKFYKKKKKYHCLEEYSFAQDNISCSKKDVLRGLHFQAPPFEQGKLIHVLKGKALMLL